MSGNASPANVGSTAELGPLVKPVTLADVLDALNVFNRPKPSEDDRPWEGGHFIRIDHLPDFINVIAAAWFSPAPLLSAERERIAGLIARHSDLTLETLEYLEAMRQGPTPEEWAELDRAASACIPLG